MKKKKKKKKKIMIIFMMIIIVIFVNSAFTLKTDIRNPPKAGLFAPSVTTKHKRSQLIWLSTAVVEACLEILKIFGIVIFIIFY